MVLGREICFPGTFQVFEVAGHHLLLSTVLKWLHLKDEDLVTKEKHSL